MGEPSDADLERLLRSSRTIAVVGLSPDPQRPSHRVARYLQAQGYRVIPVNPACQQLLGERCHPSLESIPEAVDIVDVFRRTEDVGAIADSAIAIGARCLWQQVGVVDRAAFERAQAAGLVAVIDRCLMVEHARLLGG